MGEQCSKILLGVIETVLQISYFLLLQMQTIGCLLRTSGVAPGADLEFAAPPIYIYIYIVYMYIYIGYLIKCRPMLSPSAFLVIPVNIRNYHMIKSAAGGGPPPPPPLLR